MVDSSESLVMAALHPIHFTQMIHSTNVVTKPTLSDVVLQPQVVITKATTYLDFIYQVQ